ncbi:MBL fold metallo-hydrolase, partial [Streptomyces sp. Act-28]
MTAKPRTHFPGEPAVDLVPVVPGLHMLRFPIGQAYVWCDDDGALTLVDAGWAGAEETVGRALREIGGPA